MIYRIFKSKWIILLCLLLFLVLMVIVAFFLPYPYSQIFKKTVSSANRTDTIDARYSSEINGIETPNEMRQQFKRHPVKYKFTIDDDLGVMFAYPDTNIAWMGMVFIHHFPSVSEVVLDYDGNRIFEQVSSPEARLRLDDLLNDKSFFADLQIQMSEIWDLSYPGNEVLDLVDALEAASHKVEFLGGRPQTLFDASLYLIRMNEQDIMVYEFDDEVARREVSESISEDGYEITKQDGEVTTVIHIEYLGQPNYWAKGCLLVQYVGSAPFIIEAVTNVLGTPLTSYNLQYDGSSSSVSGWQTYTNPYFEITLAYPAYWQHVDGEAHYGDKFAGQDGFFTVTAMGDVGLTLDQAVDAEIHHKLQPYGLDPIVEEFQIQGQEARLIFPSEYQSQDDNLRWQAALLALYPRPISLVMGNAKHVYPILALYADPAHIRSIVETLKFDAGGVTQMITPLPLTENPTLMPVCTPPACAPDETYHCPDDCPGGCGTVCATATPGVSTGTGQVWGKICYPGETNPDMTIYFQEINTQQILEVPIAEGQESYNLEIQAGVYTAFAWLTNTDFGGGFTKFVSCNPNLSPCTDHNLVPFLVQENHVVTSVDICDWDTGSIVFPAFPEK